MRRMREEDNLMRHPDERDQCTLPSQILVAVGSDKLDRTCTNYGVLEFAAGDGRDCLPIDALHSGNTLWKN